MSKAKDLAERLSTCQIISSGPIKDTVCDEAAALIDWQEQELRHLWQIITELSSRVTEYQAAIIAWSDHMAANNGIGFLPPEPHGSVVLNLIGDGAPR